MPVDPSAREKAVAELLDQWPWNLGGIIIGGYVSAAYGQPRYSNDIDIVIPVASLKPLLDWLTSRQPPFVVEEMPADLEQNYAGKIARLKQGDITLDILPGGVMDRQAKVHVPETWISQDPRKDRLVLQEASTRTAVPVCRPEAFWALKLQSGRRQDLGDLFAIRDVPVDLEQVAVLFRNLETASLRAKLQAVKAGLDVEKTMHDTIAARGGGSPTLPSNVKAWEQFQKMVRSAIPF